jgi:hypothetical protein
VDHLAAGCRNNLDHLSPAGSLDHLAVDDLALDHLTLNHLALNHLALDHLALDHLALDHVALDHLPLDHLALDQLAMDHRGLDNLALDHLSLDHLALHHLSSAADHLYHLAPEFDISVHLLLMSLSYRAAVAVGKSVRYDGLQGRLFSGCGVARRVLGSPFNGIPVEAAVVHMIGHRFLLDESIDAILLGERKAIRKRCLGCSISHRLCLLGEVSATRAQF